MNKNVWIINHYAGNTFFEKGGRHYWFAKYLKKNAYDPVVFACNTKHGVKDQWIETKDLWIKKQADDIDVPYVFVYAPTYEGNGKDRIVNMVSFYRNVQRAGKQYAELHGKPDVIIASSVHPLTLVAGIKLAKYFGVKCINEIRDLWPESIFTYSGRIKREGLLGKLLYRGERWIYKKSDALVFTMAGGADYIKEHGWNQEHGGPIDLKRVYHINNGVDLEVFDNNVEEYRFESSDLDEGQKFKVVYAGSVRRVNNVGALLDAAKLMDPEKVAFLIFGDGDEKEILQNRAAEEGIQNVFFKGRVAKQYIPSIDKRADLNVVHWETSPLIRYGDSSNKSFEYFAAGRPILFTTRPAYSIVEQYECGLTTEDQKPETIAASIDLIRRMPEEKKNAMCENARKAAEAYDFRNLTKKLIEIIEQV